MSELIHGTLGVTEITCMGASVLVSDAARPESTVSVEVGLLAAYIRSLSSGVRYIHTQSSASSVWTVAHNLNCRPSVDVVDHLGGQIFPDITWVDDNIVQVTHGSAIIGAVYVN